MAGNTRITIETPAENQIVEIAYDGTETLAPPLTLADHLTKQAGKIDFDAVINGDDEEDDGSDQHADSDQESSEEDELDEGLKQWPWDSVRNKLRSALTEMSVLADVITVATKECGGGPNKEGRRYMVLDGPVQVETPPQDQRNIVTLVAKKKSLDIPAKILVAGAEHLKALQSEAKEAAAAASKQSQSTDFHTELLRLRQNWRLKKVSNTILGDLSYRTAGSTFKQV
jgi:mediator of RNA polymerase II transcription subunit 17